MNIFELAHAPVNLTGGIHGALCVCVLLPHVLIDSRWLRGPAGLVPHRVDGDLADLAALELAYLIRSRYHLRRTRGMHGIQKRTFGREHRYTRGKAEILHLK